MRVFLDANVLFSASNQGSNIAELIAWLTALGTAITSDLAVEEARKNLTLKRPPWLSVFEAVLSDFKIVSSAYFELPVLLAVKDVPLLCAAIRSECRYFTTGDRRDFGHLFGKSVQGVEIISLLRLSEILAGRET